MPKIKIAKIAYGSLATSIGDGTLGYSSGVSFKAQEVCGLYIDIPPVLSRDYSTLLWQYYPDTDNYMVTHVQGRHVEDRTMGRVFSYRAAFEVSRDEMNHSGFSVGNIMQSIPRIQQYQKGEVWSEDTEITKYKPSAKPDRVRELAQVILCAIIMQRRLFISIPTQDRVLRDNGIFASEEFRTLIEAIDSLDVSTRRYASFAFCADEHYQKLLSGTLITMYVRESNFQLPQDALQIDYEQIGTQFNIQQKVADFVTLLKTMPGASEKLLPLSDMLQKLQNDKARLEKVRTMKHSDFTADDFKIWISDGNTVNELSADDWTGFNNILSLLDSKEKKTFFANHKQKILSWFLSPSTINHKPSTINHKPSTLPPLALISQYKDIFDAETLIAIVSAIDASKNVLIVDGLIQNCKKSGKVANDIIQRSLRSITGRKINEMGLDIDLWLKFIDKLKDKEGKPLKKSWAYYTARISEMSDESLQTFRNNIVNYEQSHPRIAKSERFTMLMNAIHLISEKKKKMITEPKSPSNSKAQEHGRYHQQPIDGMGGINSEIMETGNEHIHGGQDAFDELYERLQTQEKRSATKGKIIFSAVSFIVGILLTCGVAWLLHSPQKEGPTAAAEVPAGTPVDTDSIMANVALNDSTCHILNQLALSADTTHCINPDSVFNMDDLKQVYTIRDFDSIYASWIRKYADTLCIKEIKVKL